jgi:Protein of unknown function (DUF3343)
MGYGVVLFISTHQAIRAEKLAKGKNLSVKLIPVPRHFSSDCGVCLRFSWEQKGEIEAALNEGKVKVEEIRRLS